DIFLQGGRIAPRRYVADARAKSIFTGLLDDVGTTAEGPIVKGDHTDKAQPAPFVLPLAIHEGRADEGLLFGKHPVKIKVARCCASINLCTRDVAFLDP